MQAPLRHFPGVDALRGLSVILVVLHHVAIRIHPDETAWAGALPQRALDALGYNGFEAVFIFFVISGFLITHHTIARHGGLGAIDARAFYARRLARIAPPLLAVVAALSAAHLLGLRGFVIDRAGQSLGRAVVAALGLHLNWYEGQTGYLPGGWDVLWSLSIEELFYLGFPLLCLAAASDRRVGVACAALALSLPLTRELTGGGGPLLCTLGPWPCEAPKPTTLMAIWREKAWLPGMAGIATGVTAALIARHGSRTPAASAALRWVGLAMVALVLGWGDVVWRWLRHGAMLTLTLGTAAALVGLHDDRRAPRAALEPLRSFGRLSYEIYLTHMFVVLPVTAAMSDLSPGGRAAAWPVALALSWGAGWAFARGLSRPADVAIRRALLPAPRA